MLFGCTFTNTTIRSKHVFPYKRQASHHERKIVRDKIYFFKFRSKGGVEHLTIRKRIKVNATIHVCAVRGVTSLLKGGLDEIKFKKNGFHSTYYKIR